MAAATFLGRDYLSQPFIWQDTAIVIDQGLATVTVTELGLPRQGTVVRAYTETGMDTGMSGISNQSGQVIFRLPIGEYRFMALDDEEEYWSGLTQLIPHQDNQVTISTGGGTFTLQLTDNTLAPLVDVTTSLYDRNGEIFLNQSVDTDPNGRAVYNLADGEYQIAIDYMGYRWWTGSVTIPTVAQQDYVIDHAQTQVSVLRQYNDDILPVPDIEVVLHTPEDSVSQSTLMTNDRGQAVFFLPRGKFQAKVDYLGTSYNSEIFNRTDTEIVIEEGIGEVHVMESDTPLAGIQVTVSDKSGTPLGISGVTDDQGRVLFRLPAGLYRFSAQLQDVQLQTTAALAAHQQTTVTLENGSRTLSLILLRDKDTPLTGVTCSLDDENETTGVTDQEGKVVFPVVDGVYTITAHYSGGEFFTKPLVVPEVLSTTLLIEHQDVTVTVYSDRGEEVEPLAGVTCELVRTDGETIEATGIFGTSDAEGRVTFSVPLQQYMLRAEYMGSTFTSDPFDWYDSDFYIPMGTIRVQVYASESGGEEGSAKDIPIQLYSDKGEYLEITHHTDAYGETSFIVPDGEYQLRADYQGSAYWSDLVHVSTGDYREVDLYLDMELATNDPVNNPFPTRYDGPPPIYHPLLATIGTIPSPPTVTSVVATDPAVYYPINDHLGTSQLILDEQGYIVWQANILPFGSADIVVDLLPNHFRFPGQYFDAETGLHYNWHRFYDPETGRYISADPIGLTGGINLYAYVQNDPVNWVDPDGLARITGIGTDPIYVHPNDVDPNPSKPHGHVGSPNSKVKVDSNTGKIYKNGKYTGKKLTKKQLKKFRAALKGRGLLSAPLLLMFEWQIECLN
ncbi:MAG TPA: hypothetical protein ENI88_13110, partial [Desulfobulbus sp.]|nr:hypothetical protein [Desulfobulbus sp.]